MNHEIMPEMLERKVIYESDWVALYSDKVRMPDGRIFDSAVIIQTMVCRI